MSAGKTSRDLLLEQIAIDLAHDWTAAFRLELAREGRPIDGGWPGTLSEARARAGQHARAALSKRAMAAPTAHEVEHVARLTTEKARRVWRRSVDPTVR